MAKVFICCISRNKKSISTIELSTALVSIKSTYKLLCISVFITSHGYIIHTSYTLDNPIVTFIISSMFPVDSSRPTPDTNRQSYQFSCPDCRRGFDLAWVKNDESRCPFCHITIQLNPRTGRFTLVKSSTLSIPRR